MIAFITGSGFYDFPGMEPLVVSTRFGEASLLHGNVENKEILLLPRHGQGHARLPNHINHRANLLALKEAGATAVISTSVCGLLRADWPLGAPLLANDLLFLENRLPDGNSCTIFDIAGTPDRGHLLPESFFDPELSDAVRAAWAVSGMEWKEGVYAHVNGPRFNSRVEIRLLRSAGADFLSQTCGPEAVLANELEMPFALTAFSVDYANGVSAEPTAVDTLKTNLAAGSLAFRSLIRALPLETARIPFKNFVYRFGKSGSTGES